MRQGSTYVRRDAGRNVNSRCTTVDDYLFGRRPNSKLADILEQRAREDRQAVLDMKNDKQDAEDTSPDTHLQKLAGIGDDGREEQERFRLLDKPFTESDIFKNWLLGKSPQPLKQGTAAEEGLVAIDNSAVGAAEIVQKRNQPEPPIVSLERLNSLSVRARGQSRSMASYVSPLPFHQDTGVCHTAIGWRSTEPITRPSSLLQVERSEQS